MATNPFTEDPTMQAEYADGRWISRGRRYTTRDVTAINERLASEVARINGRQSLSPQAKQIAIAKAYRTARDQVQGMRQAEADRISGERTRLSRRLFGHEGAADAQTIIVRRDAADRAARLTSPEEAEQALQRAEAQGDTHLAQAIAGHSLANLWNGVVQTWVNAHPDIADTAQQLEQLPNPNDGAWKLRQAMTYTVMPPQELGGMPDHQVDRLADTVLDGDQAA